MSRQQRNKISSHMHVFFLLSRVGVDMRGEGCLFTRACHDAEMDKAGKYSNLFDCFGKIAKAEGVGALYRGLPAVRPLTVNKNRSCVQRKRLNDITLKKLPCPCS